MMGRQSGQISMVILDLSELIPEMRTPGQNYTLTVGSPTP